MLTTEHGFDLKVGGRDETFDPSQYLHMEGCDRCGKLNASVSELYWNDRKKTLFLRRPTLDEVIHGLVEVDQDFWLEHINTIKDQYGDKHA